MTSIEGNRWFSQFHSCREIFRTEADLRIKNKRGRNLFNSVQIQSLKKTPLCPECKLTADLMGERLYN